MHIPDYSNKELQYQEAVELLKQLISEPSVSRSENKTADLIEYYLLKSGVKVNRQGNNVWSKSGESYKRPLLLLNSHHDTVKPAAGYTKDPHEPIIDEGRLYGLGSNDAGASLVCLLMTYLSLHKEELNFDLVFLASAEEEISGDNGVASVLPLLGNIAGGIVGEPTQMNLAVAEKGLMVLDGLAIGKSGHAARNEGVNAIYQAMDDIVILKSFRAEKTSEHLGPMHVNVTMIQSGTQHNVVPDQCSFVVDVRTTDGYSNEETLAMLQSSVRSKLTPRSTRLQPSFLPADHVIRRAADQLQLSQYGSPTLSDQALMPFATCKIGPGDSARSHTPDEYILLDEIHSGIEGYHNLLMSINKELA
ncbi:MAG: acetylornithine deacetylase [Cyclobacteriaceae bacterium]|jgi:acetylornithine deacetylase